MHLSNCSPLIEDCPLDILRRFIVGKKFQKSQLKNEVIEIEEGDNPTISENIQEVRLHILESKLKVSNDIVDVTRKSTKSKLKPVKINTKRDDGDSDDNNLYRFSHPYLCLEKIINLYLEKQDQHSNRWVCHFISPDYHIQRFLMK